jgi:two-component system OmpR family sensor kinase
VIGRPVIGRPVIGRPAALDDRPVRTGSLRTRVIVSVLGLLLVVLLALGATVNLILGERLRADLHQRLADRASLAQVLIAQDLSPQQLTDRLTGAGITATVSSSTGTVTGRDQLPPPPGLRGPRPPRPQLPASTATITTAGGRLSASIPVDGGRLTLQASLADIDRTLSTLRSIELIAGAATLLITGLLLVRVVGLALAPLARMTTLAHRIAGGTRGRRLRPTRQRTDLGRTAAAFDTMLNALEQAEQQAQSAETRMRQFLADASHDLRTPIAGVIATAERVLRDDPARAARELRLIELIREARRAGRLVDDLLMMARLDAGAAEPERRASVDARAAVGVAAARAALLDASLRIALQLGPTAEARFEPDHLDRVLTNLVENAYAAAGPGGRIGITVHGTAEHVYIDVTDDGPGIEAADRERVFERFVRLDLQRGQRGGAPGSGLGLPIARALSRLNGGDLMCLPSDHGASLRIVLRRRTSGVDAPAGASTSAGALV